MADADWSNYPREVGTDPLRGSVAPVLAVPTYIVILAGNGGGGTPAPADPAEYWS